MNVCVCILSSDTKMATGLTRGGSIFVETSKGNIWIYFDFKI